jgi:hypothetical protein
MADYGFDGNIKVTFAATVANPSAPTVSELNAGVPLEDVLLPDGLDTPADTADVDSSKLSSTFNTAIVGRRSFSPSVSYVRGDHAAAVAAEQALVYQARGYLFVRRNQAATVAWAAGQKVESYPVQAKQPNPAKPAANALQSVEVGFTMTGNPRAYADPATVAA